jgi:hypothetical protein
MQLSSNPQLLAPASYNPQSSGQPSGGGGAVNLQAPVSAPVDQDAILNQLRSAYSGARSGIEAQNPLLEQSYNTGKADIQTSVDESVAAGEAKKAELGTTFGDLLKQQLRTYQDVGRQRQGTFSSLGSLDSSAYGEQQFRADQDFSDQNNRTKLEQTRQTGAVDSQVNSFKQRATSELSRLAIQFQQGKNAIAQALAQNNIEEAGSIQSALDQIRQRAADVQNSIIEFGNQASLLKAQGVNVRTNIGQISGGDYANQVNGYLSNLTNQAKQQYTVPSDNVSGQGFIGKSGRRYNSYAELAAAGDA